MSFRNLLKRLYHDIAIRLPLRNVVLLESLPCYADNTKAVFDEMIRRGWNQKYRMIWMFADGETPDAGIPNVRFLPSPSGALSRLYQSYLLYTSGMMICCNRFLAKRREGQHAVYLTHGAPLKNCSGHYTVPREIEEVFCLSESLKPYDAKNLQYDEARMLALGFPRNDLLFEPRLDVNRLFPEAAFTKLVYWLPTYRQLQGGGLRHSSISMPILYNETIAEQVSACAREHQVLIVVKPHFAQDISQIRAMRLSNLVFIDEAFLKSRGLLNYELLRSADALLTDYSSVYYDYLLLDRPIGLCWDDYDEYVRNEGFQVDPAVVMAGGEKLYNAEDLCAFLGEVAAGKDPLREKRNEIRDMIHLYRDGHSSARVVDELEKSFQLFNVAGKQGKGEQLEKNG